MGATCCQSTKNSGKKIEIEKETIIEEVKNKEVVKECDIIINNEILIQRAHGTPLEKYEIIKNLGVGSFGKVFMIKNKGAKMLRAMKEIKKDKFIHEDDIRNEINILKKLNHPNIIKIFEFFSVSDTYFLITEYCREGELYEHLLTVKTLSEIHSAHIIYQLLIALQYCHKNKIIHRDLKPENILIEGRDKNGYLIIKVIDFGTATIFDKNKKQSKLMGSTYYMAPEVITKNYSEKCDLWSVGVILYILLSGTLPFCGKNDQETFDLIQNSNDYLSFSDKWDYISLGSKSLISKLLERDVNKRSCAEEALNDPWLNSFNLKQKYQQVSPERLNHFIDSLKGYKANYKLQQAAIAIIVHNLPHTEEVKELERAFRLIDENGDGMINKNELVNGFSKVFKENPNIQNEVETIFQNVDVDRNGYIEYHEFIGAVIDKKNLINDENLKLAFDFFDIDGSGTITLNELKLVFCGGGDRQVSTNVIETIIGKVDDNGDGQISFEEFKNLMKGILYSKKNI